MYVGIDGDTVYYSNDGGVNLSSGGFPGGHFCRVARAWRSVRVVPPMWPANPTGGVVYAMIGAADGIEYAAMFDSFDAGVTWNPGTVLGAHDSLVYLGGR